MMQGVYNVKIRGQEVYSSNRWHQLGDSTSLLCNGNKGFFFLRRQSGRNVKLTITLT